MFIIFRSFPSLLSLAIFFFWLLGFYLLILEGVMQWSIAVIKLLIVWMNLRTLGIWTLFLMWKVSIFYCMLLFGVTFFYYLFYCKIFITFCVTFNAPVLRRRFSKKNFVENEWEFSASFISGWALQKFASRWLP